MKQRERDLLRCLIIIRSKTASKIPFGNTFALTDSNFYHQILAFLYSRKKKAISFISAHSCPDMLLIFSYIFLCLFAYSIAFARSVSQHTNADAKIEIPNFNDPQSSECSAQSSDDFSASDFVAPKTVDENQSEDILQKRSNFCENGRNKVPQSNDSDVIPSANFNREFNLCPYPPYVYLVTCFTSRLPRGSKDYYIMVFAVL